MIRIIHLC